MIQIYSPGNTDYTKNGNVVLDPTKAELNATINEAWTYNLTHPIDDLGRWKYIENGAIIKAPSFNGEQRFRIKTTNKNENLITAEAEPEFLDAKDEVFIKDIKIKNKTLQQALASLLSGSRFTGKSNIATKTSAYWVYLNALEIINGNIDQSILSRWGGEISYNNTEISILSRLGSDNGMEIRYGKNIPVNGFSEDIDYRDIATRVYPVAYNGRKMSGNGYVDSPLINTYEVIYKRTIKYDNIKLAADAQEADYEDASIIVCANQTALNTALTNAVNADYNAGLDRPNVIIDAQMILLNDVIGYEEYSNLMTVNLGDTVHCYHSKLGIITDARVTSLTYDSITEKVTGVKLTTGGNSYNYFKNVTNAVTAVSRAFGSGATGDFIIGDKTITVNRGVITGIV